MSGVTHVWPQEEYQAGSFETHLRLCAPSLGWKTQSRRGTRLAVDVWVWSVASTFWIASRHRCFAAFLMVLFLLRVSKLMKTKWRCYSGHLSLMTTRVDKDTQTLMLPSLHTSLSFSLRYSQKAFLCSRVTVKILKSGVQGSGTISQ